LKKLVTIAIVLLVTSTTSWAQNGSGNKASTGSVYSKLGVGMPIDISSTAANSAGLLGVSYNHSNVGNLSNPAHWGSTVYGLGSGGMGIHSYNVSQGAQSAKNTEFLVDQFQLQLPIVRGKVGISGSFAPLSRSNFFTVQENTQIISRGTAVDTLQYTIENEGSGGVNMAELGVGWRINDHISVGYAASAVFISQDDAYTGTFRNITYRTVNYSFETKGVGFGNRFGAHFRLPDLFQADDQLGIGAAVSLPVTIDASQEKTTGGGIQGVEPVPLGDGTVKMPSKISAGISYRPSNLLLFAAEGLYQGWSNYRNDFRTTTQSDVNFVDRYKMGLGVQYFPYVSGSDKFLSNFKYRLGASYDSGHVNVEGRDINTLMFSVGLGIRSPNSGSTIDLSFEYGVRGTNSTNLVKEQIWGLELSINLAEVMFFRPKLQ